MTSVLNVGISTCPNDTFAFCGLLNGETRIPGLELRFELLDVQALNDSLGTGRFDIVKASFAAALSHASDLLVLPAGAALGHGVGPVLLARSAVADHPLPPLAEAEILVPGAGTTAAFLMRRFHPEAAIAKSCVFSEIMPALERGEADFGVCIHEGRFTYQDADLSLVEDLGDSWQALTSEPLPLGGIFGTKSLTRDVLLAFSQGLQDSIDYAHHHPAEAELQMSKYAQELESSSLWQHVDLYVNERTRDLGTEGRRALDLFAKEASADPVLASGQSFQFLD